MSSRNVTAQPAAPARRSMWLIGPVTVIAAVIANLATLFILKPLLGLSEVFPAFTPQPIITFTVIGVAAGMVVYALVRRFSARPARTWLLVSGAALILSLGPNMALMADPSAAPFPGGSAFNYGVLIIFHVVAGLVAMLLPLRLDQR
jgi:hypothetical protein